MSDPRYDDGYYDGAHDSLTEAIQEINARLVFGYPDVRPNHYDTFHAYVKALIERTITDLQASYAKDAKWIKDRRETANA